MRRSHWLLPALLFAPMVAGAQSPERDSTAVAARIERLAVLDDDGNPIPEELIQQKLRRPKWRTLRPVLGATVGLVLFALATSPGPVCLDFDPCSPREEFMEGTGWAVGAIVGGLVGAALPDGKVDRWRAVELIREERRAAKAAGISR
jgi:hypothetical protein